MRKVIFTLFFTLILCGVSQAKNNNVIEPELQTILNQKSDDKINISIVFKSQANSAQLMAKAERNSSISKRDFLVAELKEFSIQTQNDVFAILQAEEKNGKVSDINSLWIVNTINCKASRDVIYKLASHPDVKTLIYDKEVQLITKEQMKAIESQSTRYEIGNFAAHIRDTGASYVWQEGYTGKNVVVAVLDTGTNPKHLDIKNNLWEGEKDIDGDGVNEIINGWNFINNTSDFTDDFGHGTHCAGIVCGDGSAGTTTGVAPDAKLMTLKTIARSGSGTVAQMLSGVQFAIDNGANVLSMSLGFKEFQLSTEQKEQIRQAFDNVLDAGVLACVAAGNDGNTYGAPNNVDYPAACPSPWRNPDQTLEGGLSSVLCVGAYDLDMSSRGPSTWEGTSYNDYPYNEGASMGLIRPDISAPGNLVYSLNSSLIDKYNQKSGTSQATPCVAGIVALMLEKNPKLTPAQITEIIETTASHKPAAKNNTIGAGRINAHSAVAAVPAENQLAFLKLQSVAPNEISIGQQTISLKVKNEGKGQSFYYTWGKLTIEDNPYITLVTDSVYTGAMTNEDVRTLNYRLMIDENTPSGYTAHFTLVMKTRYDIQNISYSWKNPFNVVISKKPNIVYNAVTPGSIDINEATNINVSMKNTGTANIQGNTKLTLSTLQGNAKWIEILDNEATIGSLNVGETAAGTFTIKANDETPHNRSIEFFLEVEAETALTTSYVYSFEENNEGWTSFDAANNGIAEAWWHSTNAIAHGKNIVNSNSGSGHIMSESILTNNGQQSFENPINNYLVSPSKMMATKDSKVSFYACSNMSGLYAEHFGLAVSTTNNSSASSFTTLDEWTISREQGTKWKKYEVDLSQYAGQEIYIAIHHFFTPEQWEAVDNGFYVEALNIDDIVLENVAIKFHTLPTYNDDDPNYFTVVVNNMIELGKPANFTATATDIDKIKLKWDAVENAKGYNIYRNGVKLESVAKDSTSYTDTELTHNTEYCYEIAATYMGAEFERVSACVTTIQKQHSIILQDYSPKTIYMGVNDSEASFSLFIDGRDKLPAFGYITITSEDTYLNITKPTMQLTTANTDPNDLSTYTFTFDISPDIPNNHTLTFNVNILSGGQQANEKYEYNFSFSILVKNDPNTPKNVKFTKVSDRSITLSWDVSANANYYNVYRDGELAGSTASTTFFDNNLNYSTDYCYTVTSCTAEGESEPSEMKCTTTTAENKGIALKSFTLGSAIGKNIELVATLINEGNQDTPAGTATLHCDDPYVTIVDGLSEMAAMAMGKETTANFTIKLASNTPLNHVLNFDLTTEYQGESFGNLTYTFTSDLEGWDTYSFNGKGFLWEYDSKNQAAISYSYKNGARDVDNLLILPNSIKGSSSTTLTFNVKSTYTGTNDYYQENYEIILTEIGPDPDYGWSFIADKVVIFNEKLQAEAKNNWLERSVDLSSKAGKTFWIIFRHYNCKDNDALVLDNININNISLVGDISTTSSFSTTVNPSVNTFIGEGLWSDASNWSKGATPSLDEDIIISGNATIESGNITAKSLTINDTLIVGSNATLTVNGILISNNADYFIIEDGAQIFQNNDNVAATFAMNIDNPKSWSHDRTGGWQFIASPVKNAKIADFKPQAANYDLFKYDGTKELHWVNPKKHATDFESTFQQGRAYIVSYEAQTVAYFKGILNNEKSFTFKDIKAKDENIHFKNFYLIGNPFIFDIEWNDLSASDIYNGYATVDPNDGSYNYHNSGTIKVGDGCFVLSTGSAPSLTYGTRNVKKEKHSNLNVTLSNFYGIDNAIISLDGDSKEGFRKLDNINSEISKIFIEDEGVDYGIFSFNEDIEEVQISFKASRLGDHRISIKPEGEFEYITLIDKITGVETDMLNKTYSFKALSTKEDQNRFTLKFNKKTTNETENFVYQSGDELIIEAEGTVQIIDVMGRIVLSKEINGNDRINIGKLNKAAYIVRCIENNNVKTQKIALH